MRAASSNRPCVILLFPAFFGTLIATASGQTSSLGARQRAVDVDRPMVSGTRENPAQPRNFTYERYAWITLAPPAPRTFKPGDLLTIIVREQRSFEADADLKTERKYDVRSELEQFVKPTGGGLGAAMFRRGKPNIEYSFDTKLDAKGDTKREDKLTTRITAEIIDVKPNGVLVLEARGRIEHDEEISTITLTGSCRKDDVTADNTVLSTQIADKAMIVSNKGALRAASSRGWLTKIIDLLKPI